MLKQAMSESTKTSATKSILKKEDPSKFSKMLMQHCREKKYPIPDIGFLDLLDDVANGKPVYDLYCEDEETQPNPDEGSQEGKVEWEEE